ncbi:MAG: Uma2 family endonuclease, partial [bacterium]|nr:Uma2 family endonuclease [bacterium]
PDIIFEILSPSTSHKDKGIKYNLYEKAGVKYYCIVAPKTESAEVFLLQKDKYKGPDAFKDGKILFDLAPCQIEFDFGKIFEV